MFTSSPLDKNGDPLFEVLNTVTFADEREKTIFTLHASVGKMRADGVPHRAGMGGGATALFPFATGGLLLLFVAYGRWRTASHRAAVNA